MGDYLELRRITEDTGGYLYKLAKESYDDIYNNDQMKFIYEKLCIIMKTLKKCFEIGFLALFWLTIPPVIIGYLLECIVVIPITLGNETPLMPIAQCWALGLVFLKYGLEV